MAQVSRKGAGAEVSVSATAEASAKVSTTPGPSRKASSAETTNTKDDADSDEDECLVCEDEEGIDPIVISSDDDDESSNFSNGSQMLAVEGSTNSSGRDTHFWLAQSRAVGGNTPQLQLVMQGQRLQGNLLITVVSVKP